MESKESNSKETISTVNDEPGVMVPGDCFTIEVSSLATSSLENISRS